MQKSVCIADCIWLQIADCIWLQIAFWLQIEFGCRLHLVAYYVWLFLRCSCTVIFQFSGAVGSFDKVESVDLQKGIVYSLHDIFI